MIWQRISDENDPRLADVAAALKSGELAVVPTETVYGLASTLDPDALLKVFYAKGRPEYKPLIIGVDGAEMARTVAANWPPEAQRLAEAFWPGPLSLVLPKREGMPLLVTAGGETVAVRTPQHPVAFKLIRLVGQPLVLTSANRTGAEAPTTAAEAVAQLGLHPEFVVDSGPSRLGVASTVYDVSTREVLRQGALSEAALQSALRD